VGWFTVRSGPAFGTGVVFVPTLSGGRVTDIS
jgi:hypothetical protein